MAHSTKPIREEQEATTRSLARRPAGQSNSEYKSRLFSFLFGRKEHTEWTLSLYNAINHSHHTNPDDITINTIEVVVYLGMRNDLSFLVSAVVSIYRTIEVFEQHSTSNPNMPVRLFMYTAIL